MPDLVLTVDGTPVPVSVEPSAAETLRQSLLAQAFATIASVASAGGYFDSLAEGAADANVAEGDAYFVLTGGRFYIGQKVGGIGVEKAEITTRAMQLAAGGLGTAAGFAEEHFVLASALSAFALTLLDDGDAAAMRTTLGINALPGAQARVPRPAGVYVSNAVNGQTRSNAAAVANRLEFSPFIPARNFSIDELGGYVTGAVAGNMRMGVYADDGTGYPGPRLADTGDLSTGTTGAKAAAVAVTFEAGKLYWLAKHGSAAATIRHLTAACALEIEEGDGSATSPYYILLASTAYAALPATAPAGLTKFATVPAWFRMRTA